jgi:hypothetical protein
LVYSAISSCSQALFSAEDENDIAPLGEAGIGAMAVDLQGPLKPAR